MFSSLELKYKGQLLWEDSTIYLYILIIVLTTFFAYWGKKYSSNTRIGISNNLFIFLSFFIFSFFLVFRDVGTDLPMYRTIYNNCDLDGSYFNNQEPGFLLLNRLMKFLGLSDNVAIGILGIFTVLLYFLCVSYNYKYISVSLSVFAYGCLYYFQSYSLIRMYLASGILIFASRYIFKYKYKKYIIITLLTTLIHYSAILAFIPLIFLYIYQHSKNFFYFVYVLSFILGFILINYLTNIPIFARYDEYLAGGMIKGGIGFFQIAINCPLLLLIFYCRKRMKGSSIINVSYVYTLSALFIGIMSYKVMMLGRSLVYYNILFVICIPYLINFLKIRHDRNYQLINFSFYIYFYWRFLKYLSEYLLFDQIMPYKFIEI